MVPHPRTGWLLDYPQLCSDFCKIIKILLFYAAMLGAIGYSEMRISNDFAKFLPSGEIVSKTQNCYALEAISIISVIIQGKSKKMMLSLANHFKQRGLQFTNIVFKYMLTEQADIIANIRDTQCQSKTSVIIIIHQSYWESSESLSM